MRVLHSVAMYKVSHRESSTVIELGAWCHHGPSKLALISICHAFWTPALEVSWETPAGRPAMWKWRRRIWMKLLLMHGRSEPQGSGTPRHYWKFRGCCAWMAAGRTMPPYVSNCINMSPYLYVTIPLRWVRKSRGRRNEARIARIRCQVMSTCCTYWPLHSCNPGSIIYTHTKLLIAFGKVNIWQD